MNNLVILVYADKSYYKFVFPYIVFSLKSNPDAYIDVVVDNLDDFLNYSGESFYKIESLFKRKFSIRQTKFDTVNIIPNTIRFLEVPIVESKYIYIGDIDILVFEDLVAVHSDLINKNSLDFSNIVRETTIKTGKPRLTGLHFSEFSKLYPHPDISDIDISIENDEYVLYEICKRKGNKISLDFKLRPECGIHLSLNRDPLGRVPGPAVSKQIRGDFLKWGGEKYYSDFICFYESIDYKKVEVYFSYEFRLIAFHLYSIVENNYRFFDLYASSFVVDRRIFIDKDESLNLMEMLIYFRENNLNLIEHGERVKKILAIFPMRFFSWFYAICYYITINDKDLSFYSLEKMKLLGAPKKISLIHLKYFLKCVEKSDLDEIDFIESEVRSFF